MYLSLYITDMNVSLFSASMPVMFPVGIWLTSLLKTGLSSITLQAGMLDLILLTWAVSPLVSLSNDGWPFSLPMAATVAGFCIHIA